MKRFKSSADGRREPLPKDEEGDRGARSVEPEIDPPKISPQAGQLTPHLRDAILDLVANGTSPANAAILGGMHAEAWGELVERAEAGIEPEYSFVREIQRAELQREADIERTITVEAKNDARVALARKRELNASPREDTGGAGPGQLIFMHLGGKVTGLQLGGEYIGEKKMRQMERELELQDQQQAPKAIEQKRDPSPNLN